MASVGNHHANVCEKGIGQKERRGQQMVDVEPGKLTMKNGEVSYIIWSYI